MSYVIHHFGDDGNCKIIDRCGCFDVVEYQRDMSVTPEDAIQAYFCGEMNVRRRQLVCQLAQANGNIVVQAIFRRVEVDASPTVSLAVPA